MDKCPICDREKGIDLLYPVVDGITSFVFCSDCYSDTRRNFIAEQTRIENNCWDSNFDDTCNKDNFSLWLEAIAQTRSTCQFHSNNV